jgi:hypothetical protein
LISFETHGIKNQKRGGVGMRNTKGHTLITAIFLQILMLMMLNACATEVISKKEAPNEQPTLKVGEGEEITVSEYYDFKDVPVPKEFDLKKGKSFIFHTARYTAGLLTFSGRVETDSLINYFISKMSEDGWQFLSFFKSPKNIMLFNKENRYCIISIIGKTLTTDLEIFVTPGFQSTS